MWHKKTVQFRSTRPVPRAFQISRWRFDNPINQRKQTRTLNLCGDLGGRAQQNWYMHTTK